MKTKLVSIYSAKRAAGSFQKGA